MLVGSPQSPDCEDWAEPAGITTLTMREAAGSCNWAYLGNVSCFVSRVLDSGLLVARRGGEKERRRGGEEEWIRRGEEERRKGADEEKNTGG